MYNSTNKARVLTFCHFNRKGWSLFSCLHREVRIGVLGVATLASATPRLMATALTTAEGSGSGAVALHADTLALGEASVSASRAPMAAQTAARQVLTLTHDDLAAAGVRTINDVLKLSAGVDVRQRGGFGIQTDISIDGGTHDQLTILLNGVPLVNPQTGHNAADFPINIADIERIEILEGAASRVMGSQAFSGAINVVSRSAARSPHVEAMVEGGSYGTVRGEARTAWQWGKGWSGTASGSYQRSDGTVKNSAFHGGKGYGLLSYNAADFSFDLQAGATANDFGANTFYSAAYPNQWEATQRYFISARAETKGRVHIVPQLSWVRSVDHFQLIKDSDKGENFHRGDVYTASVNAWTQWKLGKTAVGAEVREEGIYSTNLGRTLQEGQQVSIPHETGKFYTKRDDRTNISYFAEHNFLWRQVTLSLGTLAERNSAIDRKVRFYPGIDLSYRPSREWKLYASWNKSLRLPSFTDLWYKSDTQEGNVGLRPEECSSFRIGADFVSHIVTLRLKAHYQRGNHLIDWVRRTADDEKYYATSFDLDNYGAGLDARLNLTEWWGKRQPFEQFTVSYAWVNQHRRAGEAYYKSNYAMEYLRHKLVLRLNHRIVSRLSAQWTMRLQQREGSYELYDNGTNLHELHNYGTHALLDCKLSWTDKNYALFADFTNLTNHRYFDLANVEQPGLLVMGGVKINF